MAPLIATLDGVTAGTPPCRLSLGSLGAFPDVRRPRVIWLGLKGPGTAALRSLQRRIEERVTELGWEREGPALQPPTSPSAGSDPEGRLHQAGTGPAPPYRNSPSGSRRRC